MALKDNLVAHWSLEESSGSRADDFGSNTLTQNGGVGTAAGKIGQAAQFVAASSQYLSIADNAALSMGDIDFTVGAWVYLDSTTNDRGIIGKYGGTLNEYFLRFRFSNLLFEFFVVSGATIASCPATTAGTPSTSQWYFVVAWHDSIANTLNIQVNNGTVNTVAYSLGVNDSTGQFRVGDIPSLSRFMDGRIDQPFVSKRVLTTQERTSLYNGGSGLAYSQFSGTYTLSGSATASAASGSSAGLLYIPVKTLSGTATAAVAAGSGTGLAVMTPVYSLSGAATADGATGSGAGLAFFPGGSILSGSATAQSATGSGAGLLWIPDLVLSKVFTVRPQSSLFTVEAG